MIVVLALPPSFTSNPLKGSSKKLKCSMLSFQNILDKLDKHRYHMLPIFRSGFHILYCKKKWQVLLVVLYYYFFLLSSPLSLLVLHIHHYYYHPFNFVHVLCREPASKIRALEVRGTGGLGSRHFAFACRQQGHWHERVANIP